MATVTLDFQDGHEVFQNTKTGYEVDRIVIVSGLTGTGSARCYQALQEASVPQFYDEHPEISGLYVINRRAVPLDPTQVKITLHYGPAVYAGSGGGSSESKAVIECGTSTNTETVYEDVNGNLMFTRWDDPDDAPDKGYVRQGASANVLTPRHFVTFTRVEDFSPAAKSYQYTRRVNMAGWDYDPGAAARTWLCTGITGRSTDGGETYTVQYSFEYCDMEPAGNWDAVVRFTDPATGKPPANDSGCTLVDGEGIKIYQVYEEANFNGLDLV